MNNHSKCRSCGAEIQWCRTTHGKMIPIDARPTPGNIHISVDLLGEEFAHVVADGTGEHVAHFVTCPHADEWRKS